MDPISIGLSVLGFGMSLFGSSKSSDEAEHNAQLSRQVYEQEKQANEVRRKSMELQSRRQQLQNIRNVQLQRSMALNAATAQGAQFGSGLAGGLAQVSSQGAFNDQGIALNTEFGREMFGIQDRIAGLKSQMSDSQSEMAKYQGISQLGGSLMGAAGTIGKIGKGFNFGPSTGSYNNYGGMYGYTSSNYGGGWG